MNRATLFGLKSGHTGASAGAACFGWLVLSLTTLAVLGSSGTARAERIPSEALSFQVSLAPDTITVGDPIDFRMSGGGPSDAEYLWPQLADSVGAFAVLEVEGPVRTEQEGRARLSQDATLTLYRSGAHTLPALPLLALQDGDTLVAYGATPTVFVRSLLPEDPNLQNPQTALAQMKEVKGVVPLAPSRWWMWVAGGAFLAALAFLAYRWWRRRRRFQAPLPALPRARALLAPDVEFERGLAKLRARLERGELKEFYAGLSLLLRTYLERRFQMLALEATRTELLATAREHPHLDAEDERWLADFLTESDLVKFARLDRLLEEARERADGSMEWVRRTTRREAERIARGAPVGEAANASRSAGESAASGPTGSAGTSAAHDAAARSGSSEKEEAG